jgi:hypothetical protein
MLNQGKDAAPAQEVSANFRRKAIYEELNAETKAGAARGNRR